MKAVLSPGRSNPRNFYEVEDTSIRNSTDMKLNNILVNSDEPSIELFKINSNLSVQ